MLIVLKIKIKEPMMLSYDNKAIINIAHNPVHHDHMKHVEINQHFIEQKLETGQVCILYMSSSKL